MSLKNILRLVPLCLVVLLSNISITDAAELNFSVEAEIPENQLDKDKTYFDLLMKPDSRQEIVIKLGNSTNKNVTVIPQISNATTNSNGVVEYSPSKNKLDRSAPTSIKETVTIDAKQKEIDIPAYGETKLKLSVKMPKQSFSGVVAGGITLKEKPKEASKMKEDQGMALDNEYAYSIAVLLREDEEVAKPSLILKSVTPGQLNYRNTIFTALTNPEARYINAVSVEAVITKKGTKEVIYKSNQEDMQIAPNTTFNYPIKLNGKKLVAGKYTVTMDVKGSNQSWKFLKDFDITQDKAKEFNEADVSIEKDESYLIKILIVAICILIIIVIAALIIVSRSRKNSRNKRKKKRKKKKINR